MANISLNAVAYSGKPTSPGTPWMPSKIDVDTLIIGTEIEYEAGNITLVYRTTKHEWQITWEKVPENTRAAVAALVGFAFTFIDEHGTSYTAQVKIGGFKTSTAFVSAANVQYYNIDLTLREA